MRGKRSSTSFLLFLCGLGSATEVHFFGSIAITELFCYAFAPFLFLKNLALLKRDGFLPWIWLTILVCSGCVISSKVNDTYWLFMLKGIAVPAVYFSATIVFHHLLRRDLSALKWFLIGSFLSSIISIFIFQQENFTVQHGQLLQGDAAVDAVVGNALFWSSKISSALKLPISCFFLSIPISYSVAAPIACAVVSLFWSGNSGRALAAMSLASAACIFFGGKTRRKQRWIGKHFLVFLLVGLGLALGGKAIYSHVAKAGWLGEGALSKYEKQTERGNGIIDILMAGRMELFCGLGACIDRPIIGFGPRAEDRYGYAERYLYKYGTERDYQYYLNSIRAQMARTGWLPGIPDHSHIVYFWLRYGIFGLILWLYVFWQIFMYYRKYAPAVPQWYGYMCLIIPLSCWNILFSPPGGRMGMTFFVTCLLFCRAVSQGKIALPFKMEMEAQSVSK